MQSAYCKGNNCARGLIVENYNALSNKRSLQLNALKFYGIVVQRRRFIRVATLYFIKPCMVD